MFITTSALSDLTLLGILVDNFQYKNVSKFMIDRPASYIQMSPGGIGNFLWTEKNCKRIRIKLGYALSTDSNQYSTLRHNDTHMILTLGKMNDWFNKWMDEWMKE